MQSKEKHKNTEIVQENVKDKREELEEIATERVVKAAVREVFESEFSGPIPPPSIMGQYDEILPGSAERILQMAEKQSEHRQAMERNMIEAESRDGLLGVVFAFVLGLACIIAGVLFAVLVPQTAGVIAGTLIGTSGMGSIVVTMIKSTRTNYHKE